MAEDPVRTTSEFPRSVDGSSHRFWLWIALNSTFLLLLAVIWWPPMQDIFHTTSLTAIEFSVCLLVSLAVFGGIELKKMFDHRLTELAS